MCVSEHCVIASMQIEYTDVLAITTSPFVVHEQMLPFTLYVPGVFLAFSLLPGVRRARYRCMAVTLWLSGVVVNQTFTSGGVDVRTCLFVNHRHVCLYLRVIFSRLVSTAKFF